SASSFALRGMEKGSPVPDLEFVGVTGEGGKLSSFSGEKGLVLIYWATWSTRSPAILQFAEKELRRYEKLGLKFLAVNADHQEMKAEDIAQVKAVISELGITFPVVLDAGLKGYNEIGVISTPTTIILDKALKIVDAYPGFPSIARDDIPDRLDAFLGIAKEKPVEKARYLLDHKPKNYALQYYNLGKRLFLVARSISGDLKSVPEQAIERLDEAIRRDPDFFRPYLLKAIILDMAKSNGRRDAALQELKKRDFQEVYERRVLGIGYLYINLDPLAGEYFQLLASQVPDDPGVLFGQAVVAARRKDGKGAKKALDALAKNPKAPETLGFDYAALFTESGEIRPGAEGKLRLAFERLLEIERQPDGGIRQDAPVPSGAPPAPAQAALPSTAPAAPPAAAPAPPANGR
ncbi:MAG: redoxin domain-containing protein, partial [Deltaproteobacteria bacterium]|nr:redoxin domain-containing protein [Deltaproteobacteria bacterium]